LFLLFRDLAGYGKTRNRGGFAHGGIVQHDGRAARALEPGCLAAESASVTRRFAAGIAAAAVLLSLQACASSKSYMGIPLVKGQTNPELRQLAMRARTGDKQAQLELGIRFEEGRGVGRDIEKAQDMYRLAASDSGGPTWVFVPSTVKGQRGKVVPVDRGPMLRGLEEARWRLKGLEEMDDGR